MKNTSRKYKALTAALACGALFLAYTPVQAQPSGEEHGGRQGGGKRKGPPPEAFSVCEGQSSGDSCTMETPHGEATGTCEDPKDDGKLACVPEDHDDRHE